MLTTIICDLDNLLADTEKWHFQAYRDVMADHDFDLTIDEYKIHWIRDGLTIRDFLPKYNLDLDPETLHKQKVQNYLAYVNNGIDPMPFAYEFLERFKDIKRLAVATSSYKINADAVLSKLGMTDYFEQIVTRDDVTRLKPDPEIFLKAAEKMGVEPSECLVMEDAQKGIDAAHSAGMKSIAVPDVYTKDNDFSNATKIVSSLSEVTIEILKEI